MDIPLMVVLVWAIGWTACSHPHDQSSPGAMTGSTVLPDPETAAMIDSVQHAQREVDPMKVTVFLSGQRAQHYKQLAASARGLDQVNLMVMYGFEELKAGNSAQAIQIFEKVIDVVEPMPIPGKEQTVLEMKKWLGLANLRLGEQENCILNHTAASCILPIAKSGQHEKREGSTKAMEWYEDVLNTSPDDLTSKFLLNIAAMTLGKFPDGVPAGMTLPKGYFERNVDFPSWYDIAAALGFTHRGLAGGVAVEDFDGDGNLDIMTSEWGFQDQLRLYHNNGDGSFSDITSSSGLSGVTGGLNMIHADYNNDGHTDVLLLRGAWLRDQGRIPNSLLRNNGNGTFTDVTTKAGLYARCPSQNATWADFDLDGNLDLFIGNESIPQMGSAFSFPSEFYHNNGDGSFTEMAIGAGLNINAFVKGSTSGDINNDGLPDLYVSVMQGDNQLWLNTSDASGIHFQNITATAGIAEPFISFPTWMFDYDNDGWLDLFVSAYSDGSEDLPGKLLRAYGRKDDPFRPRIYHNNHDGTFTDRSIALGVTEPAFTMGCNYGDLDNDGYPDFYLGTGEPNLKSIIPNKMYRNREGNSFEDVTYAGGFGNIQKGHAVGFGDFDKDGDQDIYVVMGGSFEGDVYQDLFFENPMGAAQKWIVLKLQGVHANASAIGAKVQFDIVENGKPRSIFQTVSTGSSFGGNSLQLETGLGHAEQLVRVQITWPTHSTAAQEFTHLKMNAAYQVQEGMDPVEISYKNVPFAKQTHHHH